MDGLADMPSGLWHHTQESGQPLKKTVVWMPGPSSLQSLLISKISPFDLSNLQSSFFNIQFRLVRVGSSSQGQLNIFSYRTQFVHMILVAADLKQILEHKIYHIQAL